MMEKGKDRNTQSRLLPYAHIPSVSASPPVQRRVRGPSRERTQHMAYYTQVLVLHVGLLLVEYAGASIL